MCGREATSLRTSSDIYRPGLLWKQAVCDSCEYRASKWPRQWPANLSDCGQWIIKHPKWVICAPLHPLADTDVVKEWLARRGIVIGLIPPGDYGWYRESFVEVVAQRNGSSIIRVSDTASPLDGGYGEDARLLTVPAREVKSRMVKMLAGASLTQT